MKRMEWLLPFFLLACRLSGEGPALPFYNSPDLTPEWIATPGSRSLHTVSAFALTNQDGRTITNREVDGKICVVNFFFTTCGGICPRMMLQLKRVQDSTETNADLVFLSHTVLPETDSVARLQRYAKKMGIAGNWWLLTGDKKSIYELARSSYFANEEATQENGFLHTENCLLVDGRGRIRGVYNATLQLEMDRLIRHIRILREEKE